MAIINRINLTLAETRTGHLIVTATDESDNEIALPYDLTMVVRIPHFDDDGNVEFCDWVYADDDFASPIGVCSRVADFFHISIDAVRFDDFSAEYFFMLIDE